MEGGEDLVGQLVLRAAAGKLRGRLPSFPLPPPEHVDIPKFGTKYLSVVMFVFVFSADVELQVSQNLIGKKSKHCQPWGTSRGSGALPLRPSSCLAAQTKPPFQRRHIERAGLQLRERRGGELEGEVQGWEIKQEIF